MKQIFLLLSVLLSLQLLAQKKPLDHTVYDAWQTTGERLVSNDGLYILYTITPQEGDATLFIQSMAGTYKLQVPRGYGAQISNDSRYAVFKIKPPYGATRAARIKKKKTEDLPKDSFAIVRLGSDTLWKAATIKSFKLPAKAGGWLAYQKKRDAATVKSQNLPTQKTVDSLRQTIDSLLQLLQQIKTVKGGTGDAIAAAEDPVLPASGEGSDLFLRLLSTGKEWVFKNVGEYVFNDFGQKLLFTVSKSATDSASQNAVIYFDLEKETSDTIIKGGSAFKNLAWSEDGRRAAFVADRDTATKAQQRWYNLYLFEPGQDSAHLLVAAKGAGLTSGYTVSENGTLKFSKTGNRLFFGTAPIRPPKDTSLIDIDLVKLDIWHYNDDYLQTQQLFNLPTETKRSYTAVYNFDSATIFQLGNKELQTVFITLEGDGRMMYAATDTGRRVAAQWSGQTAKDLYAIDATTGARTVVVKKFDGQWYPSATGKYVLLYDNTKKAYLVWQHGVLKNLTASLNVPLYDEEYDMPGNPSPYGVMGWHELDSAVYVYDKYDVWKLDPTGLSAPQRFMKGRETGSRYRYIELDSTEKFIPANKPLFFRETNLKTRSSHVFFRNPDGKKARWITPFSDYSYSFFTKAKSADVFLYTRENYETSPDLYAVQLNGRTLQTATAADFTATPLTQLNPQQHNFNWGTAELYYWTTPKGKAATGILYKPEDFDPAKKYPVLLYFYEKLSDGLYNYVAPTPTPSRLNISFFVSRGYLVLAPDISYTKGHPGEDAYEYVVSGAKSLAKKPWVDAANMGIQGQSWGGYQVAYLITRTNLFKAAWAGAPVANMTSAYGGIRWESGANRQFQYERGQSRIGATLWQRPDLYIASSPLFHLPAVKTPLVIMANDADGAVPWQQGIELFTAMRRLGKKVWMLNYNGEAHNLVERKNRKDIQMREQQYFDWLLKGAPPARWLLQGVPAIEKGSQWGLETGATKTD